MLKVIPLKVSLGFVQSILPAALAVLSYCMKEPLSSKTKEQNIPQIAGVNSGSHGGNALLPASA